MANSPHPKRSALHLPDGASRLRLRWSSLALQDFVKVQEYISQENPRAARRIAQRIAEAAAKLEKFPRLGRPGNVDGAYELVVANTPYLIVYRIRDDQLELIRLWHGRQNWMR
ncbi:MAG: type II toxin-antitoxin system RelE/ParE family toxin [Panacagrimonas sp.]